MDKYSIIRFISQGSFGKVYLVCNKDTRERLILKRMKIENLHHYDKENIFNEIKISLFHDCPYLLKTKDFFIKDNYISIISKYYEKNTLENLIYQRKLSPAKILHYFYQLTLALSYLHEYNIIHRDIKSTNIFVDKNDNLVLGDFGISKILNPLNNLTGTQVGTPYYLSPELAQGIKYTNSADIWSLGVVLYEMIYQKKPFKSRNVVGLLYKIKHDNVLFPNEYNYQFLINLCMKLLNKKEIERPSATEIIHQLKDKVLNDEYVMVKIENKVNLNSCKYSKDKSFNSNYKKLKEYYFPKQNLVSISTQTNISIPSYKSYKYTLSSLSLHH